MKGNEIMTYKGKLLSFRENALLKGIRHQFRAGPEAKFGHQARLVRIYGLGIYNQLLANFTAGKAPGTESQYFLFSLR